MPYSLIDTNLADKRNDSIFALCQHYFGVDVFAEGLCLQKS
jgi:hypothetical protein